MTDDVCGVVDALLGVVCDQPAGHTRLTFFPSVGSNGPLMCKYDHRSDSGGVWFNEPTNPLEVAS